MSAAACPECGLALETGIACRDRFHELLALEARVPGGPTPLAHFFAVAAWNLQHPSLFAPGIVAGLLDAVRDALAGRADVPELRRRVRRTTEGPTRVLRRADGPGPVRPAAWPVVWPVTVGDVCAAAPERYAEQVRRWAASVVATVDAAGIADRS